MQHESRLHAAMIGCYEDGEPGKGLLRLKTDGGPGLSAIAGGGRQRSLDHPALHDRAGLETRSWYGLWGFGESGIFPQNRSAPEESAGAVRSTIRTRTGAIWFPS
jgi:hypothetical protein